MRRLAPALASLALALPLAAVADDEKADPYVEIDYATLEKKIAKVSSVSVTE
ncbi:hypothetical protein HY251_04390 [bacterium]|nr:hypothetical protein [bacterium]